MKIEFSPTLWDDVASRIIKDEDPGPSMILKELSEKIFTEYHVQRQKKETCVSTLSCNIDFDKLNQAHYADEKTIMSAIKAALLSRRFKIRSDLFVLCAFESNAFRKVKTQRGVPRFQHLSNEKCMRIWITSLLGSPYPDAPTEAVADYLLRKNRLCMAQGELLDTRLSNTVRYYHEKFGNTPIYELLECDRLKKPHRSVIDQMRSIQPPAKADVLLLLGHFSDAVWEEFGQEAAEILFSGYTFEREQLYAQQGLDWKRLATYLENPDSIIEGLGVI